MLRTNKLVQFSLVGLFLSSPLLAQDSLANHEHSQEVHHVVHENSVKTSADHHVDAHSEAKPEEFNPAEFILHHIADAHDFHIWGEGENSLSLPLPVILWTNSGLVTFMSSAFHHDDAGHHLVEVGEQRFVKYHGKIYYAADSMDEHGAFVVYNDEHTVVNQKPLDFSVTKNVFSMLLSVFILMILFIPAAASYNKNGGVPRGLAGFLEPLVVFVRDEIAKPNIGEHRYKKFMPYLLTVFFFIWVNNLIGLIPIFPFSANLTGNIAFTMTISVFTLLATNVFSNKGYWKHIFLPHVPWWLYPIMIPVELIGVISKPFALMIRLFANISAGHIIIISLTSLIFIFKSLAIAPVSVGFVLFMNFIELLVAALQAYIFTLLSSLFIGLSHVEEEHH